LESARLISVLHVSPGSARDIPRHDHTHHEIVGIRRGAARVTVGKQPIPCEAGSVLFYKAGTPHAERRADDDLEQFIVAFDTNGSTHGSKANGHPVVMRDEQGRLIQLMDWLYREWVSQQPKSLDARQAFFRAILSEWSRLCAQREHDLVRTVRAHAEGHLAGNVTLDALARAAGMSKFHFVRTYRKLTGRTPMRDVRAIRIEKAHRLLVSTDLSLEEIASRVGLGDKYRMSRLFREHVGATPKEVREAVRPRPRRRS
jgi:AraC-like DNA-binding protein